MKNYKFISVLYLLCLIENFLIRLVLTFQEREVLSHPLSDLLTIFGGGLLHDTLFFAYFFVPIVLLLLALPKSALNHRIFHGLLHFLSFLIIVLFSFQAHAEWFFWKEFHVRFNFIAVDYLIYTHEVIGNIVESYPMGLVYASILFTSTIIYLLARSLVTRSLSELGNCLTRCRVAGLAVMALSPLCAFYMAEPFSGKNSENMVVSELSRNGFYQFVSAFKNNRLDYKRFYPTVDKRVMLGHMKEELEGSNSRLHDSSDQDLSRQVVNPGPDHKYNVVFITVESLSASFMETFGNHDHLTPNLDTLARESLLFTQLYATGNRTVRGLEAITLSLPPTPGYSVVKRPHNEHLFSLGSVFKEKGYDLKFLYGGYGYFDNMNYFFENNGFSVIDRTNFADNEIDFANIWGVSDGSLFRMALKEGDKSYRQGKPFFQFLMTTSNHRPFTYPKGLIDIPPKSGRNGGVKYTDYAIGEFIEKARKKPWFKNTIFVIIADHCAGGRGLTRIPMENYHIPALIYAPEIISPARVDRVASQIDIVPTLMGLMNFSYPTKFIGKDILKMQPDEERLFLGTYENLGFFKKGILVTLSPNKKVQFERVDLNSYSVQKEKPHPDLLEEAVSFYQFSDFLLTHDLYKESKSISSS